VSFSPFRRSLPQRFLLVLTSFLQKSGLAFSDALPIARMVVLLSLATAMVSGLAIGPYSGKETGEMALFRQLLDRLHSARPVPGRATTRAHPAEWPPASAANPTLSAATPDPQAAATIPRHLRPLS
jgi:hypothetical protein